MHVSLSVDATEERQLDLLHLTVRLLSKLLRLVNNQGVVALPRDVTAAVEITGDSCHAGRVQRSLLVCGVLSGGVLCATCLADIFQTGAPLAQPAGDLFLLSDDQLLDPAGLLRGFTCPGGVWLARLHVTGNW